MPVFGSSAEYRNTGMPRVVHPWWRVACGVQLRTLAARERSGHDIARGGVFCRRLPACSKGACQSKAVVHNDSTVTLTWDATGPPEL